MEECLDSVFSIMLTIKRFALFYPETGGSVPLRNISKYLLVLRI